MAHSKRQVWEAAKAAELDGFIGAVSKAFGSDAIAEVSITAGGFITATSDDMLVEPERVNICPIENRIRERMSDVWKVRISAMRNNPLVVPK